MSLLGYANKAGMESIAVVCAAKFRCAMVTLFMPTAFEESGKGAHHNVAKPLSNKLHAKAA